jgi:hypothetical protein
MPTFRRRLLLFLAVAAPLCLVAVSCGRAPQAGAGQAVPRALPGTTPVGTSVVKGRVTHRGRPVPAGRVLFYYANGPVPVSAPINPDGTYVAYQLPAGPARVALILDPSGKPPAQRFVPWKKGAPGWEPAPSGPSAGRPAVLAKRTPVTKLIPGLTNFRVPPEERAALQALHAKYSSPYSKDSPKVEVKPGASVFDIALP